MSPSVVNSLPVILADHLLACQNARRAEAVLQKALRDDLARQYGTDELMQDLLRHLSRRAAHADEATRLWITAVMLVVQAERECGSGEAERLHCGDPSVV